MDTAAAQPGAVEKTGHRWLSPARQTTKNDRLSYENGPIFILRS
jgi:hypothetical protein